MKIKKSSGKRWSLLARTAISAVAAAMLCLALTASPAQASVLPWKGSGPGTVTVTNDPFGLGTNPKLTYSLSGDSVHSTQTWSLTTTTIHGGTAVLDYDYEGFHAYYAVTAFLRAVVIHNGVKTTTSLVSAGPVNCCTPPSSGFSYKGHTQLTLRPGDTYGFEFGGSNYDSNAVLRGSLAVDAGLLPV